MGEMAMDIVSQSQSSPALLRDGDELERETWEELRNYIGLYETVWRFFSEPLCREHSIYFRDGIDHDLEMLAMCNYTRLLGQPLRPSIDILSRKTNTLRPILKRRETRFGEKSGSQVNLLRTRTAKIRPISFRTDGHPAETNL